MERYLRALYLLHGISGIYASGYEATLDKKWWIPYTSHKHAVKRMKAKGKK